MAFGVIIRGELVVVLMVEQGGFATVRQNMKFVTHGATNGPTWGLSGDGFEPHRGENRKVTAQHGLVLLGGLVLGEGKGVGIFHEKLPAAHHAKTRANFVTKLPLNMIQQLRQLFVAGDEAFGDGGDHFFIGGTIDEGSLVAVGDA